MMSVRTVKWFSAMVILTAMVFHVLGLTPWNSMLQLLGAMYSDWKKIKGYDKLDPKSNEGQNQSNMKEFFERYKDQGI